MEDYNKADREAIVRKKWEESTIQNNFVFSKTMEMNPNLCQTLIEYILNMKIAGIHYPEREKVIENRIDSKGVRLDVYVKDKDENVFDLEMQISANSDNLAKRMRYYQGAIDADNLKRGALYSSLKPTYIIFICPFAPFRNFNRHIYTFQERCKEEPSLLLLGSETTKIILSTKGKENDISKELKSFLDYVETGIVTDDYTNEMNNAVKVTKHNEKARLDFMGFEMYLLEREMQGIEKGRQEGIEKGRQEGIEKGRQEARAEYEAETAKLKAQIAELQQYKQKYDKYKSKI